MISVLQRGCERGECGAQRRPREHRSSVLPRYYGTHVAIGQSDILQARQQRERRPPHAAAHNRDGREARACGAYTAVEQRVTRHHPGWVGANRCARACGVRAACVRLACGVRARCAYRACVQGVRAGRACRLCGARWAVELVDKLSRRRGESRQAVPPHTCTAGRRTSEKKRWAIFALKLEAKRRVASDVAAGVQLSGSVT